MNATVCVVCGEPLPSWARADRRTCSTRCRVHAWRRTQGAKPAEVDAHTTPIPSGGFSDPTGVTSAKGHVAA
jgi:hypothetical protein